MCDHRGKLRVVLNKCNSLSLSLSLQVPGRYDLRGAKEKHEKLLQSLPTDVAADLRQPEYRFMQGNSRNVTHISRMESLQAAIDSQLARLAHSEPNKRACLVTFSDDVRVMLNIVTTDIV